MCLRLRRWVNIAAAAQSCASGAPDLSDNEERGPTPASVTYRWTDLLVFRPWFSSDPPGLVLTLHWTNYCESERRLLSRGHYLRDDSFLPTTLAAQWFTASIRLIPPNFPPSCPSVHSQIGASESVCLCQTYRGEPVMLTEIAGDFLPCEATVTVIWAVIELEKMMCLYFLHTDWIWNVQIRFLSWVGVCKHVFHSI